MLVIGIFFSNLKKIIKQHYKNIESLLNTRNKESEEIVGFERLGFLAPGQNTCLFRYRKPGPLGQVRDNWLCHKVLIERG